MSRPEIRYVVAPGDGLVVRVDGGAMLVRSGGSDDAVDALLSILQEACKGQAAPGRMLSRQLVRFLVDTEPEAVPSFGAAALADNGWTLMLYGDVEAVVRHDGSETRFSGRDAATWVDRIIPPQFSQLSLLAHGAPDQLVAARVHLEQGIVPGAGLILSVRELAALAAKDQAGDGLVAGLHDDSDDEDNPPTIEQRIAIAPPALEPEQPSAAPAPVVAEPIAEVVAPMPQPGTVFTPVALGGGVAAPRAPLPVLGEVDGQEQESAPDGVQVDGILCERGHFNHPLALYCSSCGVSTVHRTRTTVQGTRPTLGVVVIDDGTTYSLDADYVVGREPQLDPAGDAGTRLLKLEDPERSISRIHAELRLQNWDVLVIDRNSANGTYIAARDQSEWTRLTPDVPHVITPGTRIAFGRRVMTYDTHHQA